MSDKIPNLGIHSVNVKNDFIYYILYEVSRKNDS